MNRLYKILTDLIEVQKLLHNMIDERSKTDPRFFKAGVPSALERLDFKIELAIEVLKLDIGMAAENNIG